MQFRDDIPTPALLLDLDAFESNITGATTDRAQLIEPVTTVRIYRRPG